MGAFKKVVQSDRLRWKQRGGIVIFVESEDDYEIIAKRWFFDQGADVLFEPADRHETGAGGGGCRAVIDLVLGARQDQISAFGLVDRDILLEQPPVALWWEEDDQCFMGQRPHGDYVRVLLRWELENYLLDPDTVAQVANDRALGSQHTGDSIVSDFLSYSNDLKDRSAASVALQSNGKNALSPGFGCNPLVRGLAFRQMLSQQLTNRGVADAPAAIAEARDQIDRFDRNGSTAPRERWERLTRMLDGKAALKYLGACGPVQLDELRGFLATRLREADSVPQELRGYVDEFKQQAGV